MGLNTMSMCFAMSTIFLCISYNPITTMQGVQTKFKLKDDKIEPPEMYLGAVLNKMYNKTNK